MRENADHTGFVWKHERFLSPILLVFLWAVHIWPSVDPKPAYLGFWTWAFHLLFPTKEPSQNSTNRSATTQTPPEQLTGYCAPRACVLSNFGGLGRTLFRAGRGEWACATHDWRLLLGAFAGSSNPSNPPSTYRSSHSILEFRDTSLRCSAG